MVGKSPIAILSTTGLQSISKQSKNAERFLIQFIYHESTYSSAVNQMGSQLISET